MVEKRENTMVNYICEVCGDWKNTEEEAIKCESQVVKKIKISEHKVWAVGEVYLVHRHDRGNWLGIIQSEVIDGHIIYPVFEYADGTVDKYSDYNDYIVHQDTTFNGRIDGMIARMKRWKHQISNKEEK